MSTEYIWITDSTGTKHYTFIDQVGPTGEHASNIIDDILTNMVNDGTIVSFGHDAGDPSALGYKELKDYLMQEFFGLP